MALKPGEDLAATLFADAHYFYGQATTKPAHHRFDKGSYVYLFENTTLRRARVEIANNAGTPDQDAFDGYLDSVHVQYSYKHTTLVTITVESPHGRRSVPLDIPEWHLPTYDPKNENKYMYKLRAIDLYFWAKEDAIIFVNAVRRMLPQPQVSILDEPITPAPHHDPMSPVVQKLENAAITDASYEQRQRTDSVPSFPGPPGPPPGPPISATPQVQNFAPMAYNPAAPAAPEAIRHREKTPPPDDVGNPLVAAAAADLSTGQAPAQGSYFPAGGIPQAPATQNTSAPVQSPFAQHFSISFSSPPKVPTSSSPYNRPSPATSSAVPPSALAGPISPQQNSSAYIPTAPTQTQAPPGGFAQYTYNSSSVTRPIQTDYGVHAQVYRPTEIENSTKHNDKPVPVTGAKPPQGKLEEKAGRLEKGVGGFLKKLEKKYG